MRYNALMLHNPDISLFCSIQLSPRTKSEYAKDLSYFQKWLETKGSDLYGVTEVLAAEYRDYLLANLSVATSLRRLNVLKSFYFFLLQNNKIVKSPFANLRLPPKSTISKTGYLSEADIGKLFIFLDKTVKRRSHALTRIIVYLLLGTGIRRDEALKLTFNDLVFSNGIWLLKIKGKGHRERFVPVAEKLQAAIDDWLHLNFKDEVVHSPISLSNPEVVMEFIKRWAEHKIIFSNRTKSLNPDYLGKLVRSSCRRAGIIQRVHPHMLRATAVTLALDNGASHRGVQAMAGWTSPAMISRYDKKLGDPKYNAVNFLSYMK